MQRGIAEVARRSWVVAPATQAVEPAAIHVGGLERVTGAGSYSTLAGQLDIIRGGPVNHMPVIAHELRNAALVDGNLFAGAHRALLNPGSPALSWRMLEAEDLPESTLGSTFFGNLYFGHWLTEDLPLTLLASAYAPVLSTQLRPTEHQPQYLEHSALTCRRVAAAHVRTLTVFEDKAQGPTKQARYRELRSRLNPHGPIANGHPGVFLWRGDSGSKRMMSNEAAVAARFEQQGFRIVRPQGMAVPELLAAIRGAHTVVSVEGSHMLHGLFAIAEGGSFLTLQPPDRFSNPIKYYADALDLGYGFVVGHAEEVGFRIDADEALRTWELLLKREVRFRQDLSCA
jgi:hypothetical protein